MASINAVVSHNGDPHDTMVSCSTCSACASDLWLRIVAQDAHCGNHARTQVAGTTQSLTLIGTMTPWAHALQVSFLCSKAWVVCSCCVLLALLQRFATSFEICGCDCCDSSIEICLARQSIYSVSRRGCWGRANHLDPGCSSVAFWQQRAVSPLWLGVASADVGWVLWIEVVITHLGSLRHRAERVRLWMWITGILPKT